MQQNTTLHEAYRDSESLFLACDVGGTNTSCAIVGKNREGAFTILQRYRYRTQKLTSLQEALQDALQRLATDQPGARPVATCISGAGPVTDNHCHLTNVDWQIDGHRLSNWMEIPVHVINDFTAISYGIPLLDTLDATQISRLPLPDGTLPESTGAVRAVVGAGTGLGIGFVVEHNGEYHALPSEGGHAAFAPYDNVSENLYRFVAERENEPPGAECFVSGQGIKNILDFFRESGRIPGDSLLSRFAGPADESSDPARMVSEAAFAGDRAAREIMTVFVESYGRVASSAALHFLPMGGLFLAGGIVTKNESWFSDSHRFVRSFLRSYRKNIGAALRRVPIFIVRDYEVSIYGAAYAAHLQLTHT